MPTGVGGIAPPPLAGWFWRGPVAVPAWPKDAFFLQEAPDKADQ